MPACLPGAHSPDIVFRNGLRGRPETRKLFTGLYLAMAMLYIRNIFR